MSLAPEVVVSSSNSELTFWSSHSVCINSTDLFFKFSFYSKSLPAMLSSYQSCLNPSAIPFCKLPSTLFEEHICRDNLGRWVLVASQALTKLFWERPTSNCQPMEGVFTAAWQHKALQGRKGIQRHRGGIRESTSNGFMSRETRGS
jgi:hypothetical protein